MPINEAEVVDRFRWLAERFTKVHSTSFEYVWSAVQGDLSQAEAMLLGEDISVIFGFFEEVLHALGPVRNALHRTGPILSAHADRLAGTFAESYLAVPVGGSTIGAGRRSADRSAVHSEAGRSKADQLKWWNSLSPQRQREYMAIAPDLLAKMGGLPASVHHEAVEMAKVEANDPLWQNTKSVTISVGAGPVNGSAGVSATESRNLDGTYSVTVSGSLAGGVGADYGKIAAAQADGSAQVTQTYTFATRDEANAFLSELEKSARPSTGAVLDAVVQPWEAGAVLAGSTAGNVAGFLASHRNEMTDQVITEAKVGTVSVTTPGVTGVTKGGSVSIQLTEGKQYDTTTGSTTGFVDLSGAAYGKDGPMQGTATGDVQASVTVGPNGSLQSMTISGKWMAAGSDSQLPSGMKGHEGSFQFVVDTTDPATQTLAVQCLHDLQSGNTQAAAAAYHQLMNTSDVVVQSGTASVDKGGVDAVVVDGEYTSETDTATSILVKSAGSDGWVQVQ